MKRIHNSLFLLTLLMTCRYAHSVDIWNKRTDGGIWYFGNEAIKPGQAVYNRGSMYGAQNIKITTKPYPQQLSPSDWQIMSSGKGVTVWHGNTEFYNEIFAGPQKVTVIYLLNGGHIEMWLENGCYINSATNQTKCAWALD